MAFCSKCGTQLSDGAKFCPKCGANVSRVNDNGNYMKSSSKKIVIPLVIVFLILCVAAGGYFVQQNIKEKEEIAKKEELRKEELRKEQIRIAKVREEEEKLKIPTVLFNYLVNQNYSWESKSYTVKYWESNLARFFNFKLALIFHPTGEIAGRVTINQYEETTNESMTLINQKESRYDIIGNTIYIADIFNLYLEKESQPIKFELEIVITGKKICDLIGNKKYIFKLKRNYNK